MRWLVSILAALALFSGCGSARIAASNKASGAGPVDVLYAASLQRLMEQDVGPDFSRATGYEFSGFAAGSSELASEIKGRIRPADVFVSASSAVDATLEGRANGNWLDWYVSFAASPLVLGYNPQSRFASQLRAEPWQDVVVQPGFLLGRTDPVLDPKGKLTVAAIELAATQDHDPTLLHLLGSSSAVFPEETLVGRLQAGQLDGGFFYANEAKEAAIPTVALSPVRLSATFTITVLERAPHSAAAVAFASYLLGPSGRALLSGDGLNVSRSPALTGRGIPRSLESLLRPA